MDLARFIAAVLPPWRSRSSGSARPSSAGAAAGPGGTAPHLRLGQRGEQAAARYLRRERLKVLFRNFNSPDGGELDIVCREGEVLVFVEVKTRRREDLAAPSSAVDVGKQRRIMEGAREWLRLLGEPALDFRFDIVEVLWPDDASRHPSEIRHLRDCFTFPEDRPYQPAPAPAWRARSFPGA